MPFQRVREHPDDEEYALTTPKRYRKLSKLGTSEDTLPSPPATVNTQTSTLQPSSFKDRAPKTPTASPPTPPASEDLWRSVGGQPRLVFCTTCCLRVDAPLYREECGHCGEECDDCAAVTAARIGVQHETQAAVEGVEILGEEGLEGAGYSFRDIEEYIEGPSRKLLGSFCGRQESAGHHCRIFWEGGFQNRTFPQNVAMLFTVVKGQPLWRGWAISSVVLILTVSSSYCDFPTPQLRSLFTGSVDRLSSTYAGPQ
ncbi:hypothetical protein C8F04DRAFT_1197483 [Mycena alexandri]|uniref:Uncharacterized protein n=1 Tax=Mycena alexandri TaxID=1745969 RepID=A0AAD6WQ81_9AGAR|nr:hypothetical protein C8F04DRAFT_1197483 [Mycena alexandri]